MKPTESQKDMRFELIWQLLRKKILERTFVEANGSGTPSADRRSGSPGGSRASQKQGNGDLDSTRPGRQA